MAEEEDVVAATEQVIREWTEAFDEASRRVESIENCGISGGTAEANNLPRLNATVQDCLTKMRSARLRLDLLAQQQPTDEQIESSHSTLEQWNNQYKALHLRLRNANLKAKENITKAVQEERELLLGGGEESTIRRRNLRTKAELTAAAEGVTESLRRSRQMMIQEVERGSASLTTLGQSTDTLQKADFEYKGHRSLLARARQLLKVMQRQDIMDRIILAVGFIFFCTVVLYIFSKRVGLLKLQRKLAASMRTDAPDTKPVSGYAHYPSSQYPAYDEMSVSVGTPERKVSGDRSSPSDPTVLDKSKQRTGLNPYDVQLDINGEEEPIPCLNSNTPPSFSKHLQRDIHDGDTSPSSDPSLLDNSNQRTRLNPVNNDMQIDIHDEEEPMAYITSSTPSYFSKHLQHEIHEEL